MAPKTRLRLLCLPRPRTRSLHARWMTSEKYHVDAGSYPAGVTAAVPDVTGACSVAFRCPVPQFTEAPVVTN